MAAERVRGSDQTPVTSVNAAGAMEGEYEVTASDGISIDAGIFDKGDKVHLDGNAARALLNDGSIKEATE